MLIAILSISILWNVYQLIKIRALNLKLDDLDASRTNELSSLRRAIEDRTVQIGKLKGRGRKQASKQPILFE